MVTKQFYELAWKGLNIEPIEENYKLFNQERVRDINLNVAVSNRIGEERF